MTRLAQYTTLGLGGAATVLEAPSQADVVALVHEYPGARILGGGSNVVAGDAGVVEPVIRLTAAGHVRHDDQIIVSAGTAWDDFVAQMVAEGRSGIEALSGIPGCVGATPIQNMGAYGQEVAETIAGMRVLVRRTGEITTWPAARAQFGYRSSFFKEHPGEYVVMAVAFDLPEGLSAPVKYAELAGLLQVEIGQRVPVDAVRQAVLELRRGKGMVLDPTDPDTRSAGSFFTNPIVDHAPEGAPGWPQPDGRVKTSAAWLIEHAGIHKGFALPGSGAAVSSKHTLALTNRGGTTEDLLELARHIRSRVVDVFDIVLLPEPVMWGCAL